MSLAGLDKNNSSTLVGTDKTATTLLGMKKSGEGWDYDQSDITYDMDKDPEGRKVYYDAIGTATTLTGLDKTNA